MRFRQPLSPALDVRVRTNPSNMCMGTCLVELATFEIIYEDYPNTACREQKRYRYAAMVTLLKVCL